jgi:hypothetical protein
MDEDIFTKSTSKFFKKAGMTLPLVSIDGVIEME